MAVVAMFKSNQYRWWAKLWCSKPDQCGLIKYSWAKLRCSNIDQLRMIKCSSSCWTARGLMMIGSLIMIKIINNVGHYSFFFMALVNRHQPPAFNNVHKTMPSGVLLPPPYPPLSPVDTTRLPACSWSQRASSGIHIRGFQNHDLKDTILDTFGYVAESFDCLHILNITPAQKRSMGTYFAVVAEKKHFMWDFSAMTISGSVTIHR